MGASLNTLKEVVLSTALRRFMLYLVFMIKTTSNTPLYYTTNILGVGTDTKRGARLATTLANQTSQSHVGRTASILVLYQVPSEWRM